LTKPDAEINAGGMPRELGFNTLARFTIVMNRGDRREAIFRSGKESAYTF
jgi:hypothetical protein